MRIMPQKHEYPMAAIMDELFDYFMGVRYDSEVPVGMEELIIPPCTYAVFPSAVDTWERLLRVASLFPRAAVLQK